MLYGDGLGGFGILPVTRASFLPGLLTAVVGSCWPGERLGVAVMMRVTHINIFKVRIKQAKARAVLAKQCQQVGETRCSEQ